MGNVTPITDMELIRGRRRINEYDDIIDRFVRVATEANASAIATENAKLAYLDTLNYQTRRDLGYV